MNYQKLKFLPTNVRRNSSLIKSFQDVLLSFLLMKKINNALKEKTLIRYEIKEKLDYKPATFEIVEEKEKYWGAR